MRKLSTESIEMQIISCNALQLFYSGRTARNPTDTFPLLDLSMTSEQVAVDIAEKSFAFNIFVTREIFFNTIAKESCSSILSKIYAVMADALEFHRKRVWNE